jgi:phenylacetate-coenzyme A ligase PaaK-like adenylate-forming protein
METVQFARTHSRFYKENLAAVPLNSWEDVRALPFTFPDQIRRDPNGFLCIPQREIKRIVTLRSSGTEGEEKRIFFSQKDLDATIDFFQCGMSNLTHQTDRVLILFPGTSCGSIGDLLERALKKSDIACFKHGVITDMEETAGCIVKNDITCLTGIPLQILQLSRQKTEIFQKYIRTVLLSSDYVPKALIRELTERCGCRAFTHYGMTEMGYGGGVECQALDGYHMREGDLYIEILDPVTGRPVRDGQAGEVTFTTLTRRAMPLIRYRTGDLASFSPVPCPCGTFLKTISRVCGRVENRVRICGGSFLYFSQLDEWILPFQEVLDYEACLERENVLQIEVVIMDGGDFQETRNKISQKIHREIQRRYGCQMQIRLTRRMNGQGRYLNSMEKRKFLRTERFSESEKVFRVKGSGN